MASNFEMSETLVSKYTLPFRIFRLFARRLPERTASLSPIGYDGTTKDGVMTARPLTDAEMAKAMKSAQRAVILAPAIAAANTFGGLDPTGMTQMAVTAETTRRMQDLAAVRTRHDRQQTSSGWKPIARTNPKFDAGIEFRKTKAEMKARGQRMPDGSPSPSRDGGRKREMVSVRKANHDRHSGDEPGARQPRSRPFALRITETTHAACVEWTQNKSEAGVGKMMDNPAQTVWVAEVSGEIAAVRAVAGDSIVLNYVAPEYRLLGVSKALLATMEGSLRNAGISLGKLVSTRTALRFYPPAAGQSWDPALAEPSWKRCFENSISAAWREFWDIGSRWAHQTVPSGMIANCRLSKRGLCGTAGRSVSTGIAMRRFRSG